MGKSRNGELKVSESKQQLDVDEDTARGNWGNQCDFFLSCLGYAVGLGNVWRFPYLCYRNGGGAFLIPYAIMLFLAGLPLFFLELALGQYSSLGPNKLFHALAPVFKGLGYGMLFVSFLVAIYYNMIIAWTLFYTFASFTSQVGWEFCGQDFNTKNCYNQDQNEQCIQEFNGTRTYWNNTCTPVETFCNFTMLEFHNYTHCYNASAVEHNETHIKGVFEYPDLKAAVNRVSPAEDYFSEYMLKRSDSSWENFGELHWQLVLCLLLAWIIVGLCLIKGVQSSGKVVYFTALFPYVVLFILLIRGATLEGSYDGVIFYITPRWEKLRSAQVWADAATQIFYSLGPSFGGLITLASYNKFHNNCHRDAILIALSNCSTSIFAGFVIFCILGFMANQLNVDVGDVVNSGPGLAFIAYPEAVTKLPVTPLWAFLFFFMLITLGLDSQFTMVETLTTAVFDQFTNLRKYKPAVVMGTCVLCFLLGLTMCAEGGIYMFTLIDWYSAGWSLLILSLTEVILVMWVYGYDRFVKNIEEMGIFIPKFMKFYWRATWQFITPVLLCAILIFSWYNYKPAYYGDYIFPVGANLIGWLMAFGSVALIPLFGIYEYYQRKKKGKLLGKALVQPTDKWGPAYKREKVQSETNEAVAYNVKLEASYINQGFDTWNGMKVHPDAATHM